MKLSASIRAGRTGLPSRKDALKILLNLDGNRKQQRISASTQHSEKKRMKGLRP